MAVWDGFTTQLRAKMTILGHFGHRCSTFQAKTATALPALIIGYAPRGSRSRKDSTKGEIMDLRSMREVATLPKLLYI